MAARQITVILIAGLTVVLAIVYFIFDPAEYEWMPKCMVHTLTGLDCPGCGSQRAVHAILHGDIAGAFRANALLLLMVPYVALIFFAELFRGRFSRLFRALYSRAAVIGVLAAVVMWGIFRNLVEWSL